MEIREGKRGQCCEEALEKWVGAWDICSRLESVATMESKREERNTTASPLPKSTSLVRWWLRDLEAMNWKS